MKNETRKEIELNLYYRAYNLEVEKVLLRKTQNPGVKKGKATNTFDHMKVKLKT